jgi:hypothetical protein
MESGVKADRKVSSEDGNGSSACSGEDSADAPTEIERPAFKQTSSFRKWEASKFRNEKLRSYEAKMRKQELLKQNPQPDDLQKGYRFWELKQRKGELDPLLRKAKQTWLLDKVAEIPETLQLGTTRTFWEVKATDSNGQEKRCLSMPVRERPPSLCPAARVPLREGYEKCDRSEQEIHEAVFAAYFDGVDEDALRKNSAGCTLMVKDLRNKFSIEDVLGVLDELGADHVDYVFLPLSVWETKKSNRDQLKNRSNLRNKAYCFVHFSDAAATEAFVDRLSRYELPTEARSDGVEVRVKKMHASPASIQGIVPNLLQLMDMHSRKWHPRAGALVVRLGDTLVPVHVAALRAFLLELLQRKPETTPGCLSSSSTLDLKPSGNPRAAASPGKA